MKNQLKGILKKKLLQFIINQNKTVVIDPAKNQTKVWTYKFHVTTF